MKANVNAIVSVLFLVLPLAAISQQHEESKQNQEQKYNQLVDQLSNNGRDGDAGSDIDIEKIMAADEASEIASSYIMDGLQARITKMFGNKVKTAECRAKVANHFKRHIHAIAAERPMPFSDTVFNNECPEEPLDLNNLPEGVSIATLMGRTYQPPKEESLYIDDHGDLKLLYGILTHGDPSSTIRLIETLNGENTMFVVHVDGKEESDESYHTLVDYAMEKDYLHILPAEFRVRVNWGGFSMVNATLQMMKYAFALLPQTSTSTQLPKEPLQFHKFIHLSSSTYPIRSNTQIRKTIASYPLEANLMFIAMKPVEPNPAAWQYFVECDDAVHRIYRLHPLTMAKNGIQQYMGSQWFIISNEFAEYLAKAEEGSLVQQYIEYSKHVIIADEAFFSTILRNSKFCTMHHNSNFLHLQFDRWESDLDGIERDERKCLMPDPDKCGRSPTILTKDYLFAIEMTEDLFARKFSDEKQSELKDILDMKRAQEEEEFRDIAAGNRTKKALAVDTSFEGHGVLIVAKGTMYDHDPLCMGIGPEGNKVKLVPCFREQVLSTLSTDWATGAVIKEEVLPNSRWEVGPCSSDGSLKRNPETAEMVSTRGMYSQTGPHCMIKQLGGARNGRCIDIEGERVEPGGQIQVFPCFTKWHQMFTFGDGKVARNASIFGSVPMHIINALKYKGKDQAPYLCFGVVGRSKIEYTPWAEDGDKEQLDTVDFVPKILEKIARQGDRVLPVRLWKDKQLVTVPCSNDDAIIEFVFVPFIVEDEDEDPTTEEIDSLTTIEPTVVEIEMDGEL